MKYTILLLAWILYCVAACALDPPAAMLTGRVTDPSNAVVANVSVRVENIRTHRAFTTRTDPQGNYAFHLLPPGSYRMFVEAPEFAPYKSDDLLLTRGQTREANIMLQISTLVELVRVTAKAPALEAAAETKTWNFQDVIEMWQARESSAKDLGEALTMLDGLWKVRKGGIANDVVLRGFQQDNLNVLVDGSRIYGACPNNMDPAAFHVDFSEVEKVEVTKGAFDVRDQGSLGGTVNIVSKTPSPGLHVTPSLSLGSFGYYNPSITASGANRKFHGLAGYSLRISQPYRDGRGQPFTSYANYRDGMQDSRAFDVDTAWFKIGASPRENHHFDLSYTRQRGGQVLYPYLQMDALYDNADRFSASYHIDGLSTALKHLRMESYFSHVSHYMTDHLRSSSVGASRPYSMATLAETRALGGRVEAEFSNFTAGVEGYRRAWNAANTMRMGSQYAIQPSIPDVTMLVGGAYGEYRRLFVRKLWFNAGGRLDTEKSDARSANLNTDLFWAYNGTRSLSATNTNPSGSAWLTYALANNLEIFAGVGHTVRVPDPQERYFALKRAGTDWVGNPNLRPTGNTEIDLGANYKVRRFSLRPTLFYSDLSNYVIVHGEPKFNPVVSVTNTTARIYENVEATIYGGELSYSLGLTRSLQFFGGMSYSRGTKQPDPALGIMNRNLSEMPPLRSHSSLRYGNHHLFAEIEGIAVNAQGRVDSELGEMRTPGYAILNLKTGIHTGKLNLTVGLDNLLDRFYYEYFSFQRDPFRLGVKVPEPGRSAYLSVSYSF